MIVAGFGCMSSSKVEDVLSALDHALASHGRSKAELAALATGPQKANEPALRKAAQHLGFALQIAAVIDMQAMAGCCLTRSPQSLVHTGLPSLSEAAALAVAGPDARLLGPRVVQNGVTCALAHSGEVQ